MIYKILNIILTLLFALTAIAAVGKGKQQQLVYPKASQSLETLVQSIRTVHPLGDSLIVLPIEESFLIKTPFREIANTSEEKFGILGNSSRVSFGENDPKRRWDGIAEATGTLVFLDGLNSSLFSLAKDSLALVSQHTFAWDMIKPPADRGGEAPLPEQRKMLARFYQQYRSTPAPRFTGLSRLPTGWVKGKPIQYMMSTHLPSFPIVVLGCEENPALQCMLERFCFVEDTKSLLPNSLNSIAIDRERRTVYIGDESQNAIHSFHFESCFNITRGKTLHLPPEIKKLSGIHIDSKRRLWISSQQKDDYRNASVYYYEANEW